jgi:hypothetical protein
MKADFNFESFLKDRVGLCYRGEADQWATKVNLSYDILTSSVGQRHCRDNR